MSYLGGSALVSDCSNWNRWSYCRVPTRAALASKLGNDLQIEVSLNATIEPLLEHELSAYMELLNPFVA